MTENFMDSLINNEKKINNEGKQRDEMLINHKLTEKLMNKNKLNLHVKFLPNKKKKESPICTVKKHYCLFKQANNNNNANIEPAGVFPEYNAHFDVFNPIIDLMWAFYNASEEKYDLYWNIFRDLNDVEENYINIFVISSSEEEFEGKVFTYKLPKRVKDNFIIKKYKEDNKNVFSDDYGICKLTYEQEGANPLNRDITTEISEDFIGSKFSDVLKNKGMDMNDIMKNIVNVHERYGFNKDEELKKIDDAKAKLVESLYQKYPFIFKDNYLKRPNEWKPFIDMEVNNSEDDSDEINEKKEDNSEPESSSNIINNEGDDNISEELTDDDSDDNEFSDMLNDSDDESDDDSDDDSDNESDDEQDPLADMFD